MNKTSSEIKGRNAEGGFTLIELSIVLVIIGLIVSGVLVGQDLIQAARNRALVSQFQDTDTATNTFQLKYDGIPGDMDNAVTFLGAATNGDGDGVIELGGSQEFAASASEVGDVWEHMSLADLMEAQYAVIPDGAYAAGTHGPLSETNAGVFLISNMGGVAGFRTGNYLILGNGPATTANAAISAATGALLDSATANNGLSPEQAYAVDNKIDDGAPGTGVVRAVTDEQGTAFTAGATACVYTGGADYNLQVDTLNCAIAAKFSGI